MTKRSWQQLLDIKVTQQEYIFRFLHLYPFFVRVVHGLIVV